MRNEGSMLRALGGVLFGLLLVFAFALPAAASHEMECEDDATCTLIQDPITNTATATTGAITNINRPVARTGAITNTNTTTGGTSSVGNVTGGASSVGDVTGGTSSVGDVTVGGSDASVGDITGGDSSATVGDVTGGSVGDVTGGSVGDVSGGDVGDIDNSSGASVGDVSGGDAEGGDGGEGGAGGNVNIDYPDQPVSSPAMSLGGVCQSAVSLTTKDAAASIGTGDQLCRHIELVRLSLVMADVSTTEAGKLAKITDAERLYQEILDMEHRGSWFRRWKITSWITGLPVIGRLF